MPRTTHRTKTAATATTKARTSTTPLLTAETARSAIYLDFEGFKNERPALVGVLVDDSLETIVLDPVLRPAGEEKGLRVTGGEPALLGILERARLEDRLICAFGNREYEAARDDFGVDLGGRFVNVQPLAKRWWKCQRTEQPKRRRVKKVRYGSRGYSLEFFENGLGLERQRRLKSGKATKWLRGVRDALVWHEGDWSRLTDRARYGWTDLLDYNEVDVRNLAALARWVAE